MLIEKVELEDLVNAVDYGKLHDGYIPSKFALDFITFIKLVNDGKGEENKSPVFHYDMLDQVVKHTDNLFVAFRGSAKALCVDTSVMTPSGYKRMGDLVVDDSVIDRNGKVTSVTHVSEEFTNRAYEIVLCNGDSFIANEDHLHIVMKKHNASRKGVVWNECVVDTNYLARQYPIRGDDIRYGIPFISSPIEYSKKPLVLDPYVIGMLLERSYVNTDSSDISLKMRRSKAKNVIDVVRGDFKHERVYRTDFVKFDFRGVDRCVLDYRYGLPDELVYGSVEDRLEFIRGLSDFHSTVPLCMYSSVKVSSEKVANDIKKIVHSLGGYSTIRRSCDVWYVKIIFKDTCPFTVPRYAELWKTHKYYKDMFKVSSVKEVSGIVSKCISVSSDTKSYLIGASIVTHNTSVIHEYMTLYIATYGGLPVKGYENINVGMYVADTVDNGIKNMRKNLEFRWLNSEFLQKFVPVANITDTRWEFVNANGHKYCVRGFGASSGVRGFKEYGKRPTIGMLDDLLSDKNAQSPTIVSDIEDIIYKAVRQAMHPSNRMLLWTGTPFNKRDPIYTAAGSAGWNTRVYPICEKFPCDRKDFVGAWEDRFSYDSTKAEYNKLFASGKIHAFNQELMLRIISDDDRLVSESDLVWYERDSVLRNKGRYNFYITTDFAVSEKDKADYSVIAVWAYTNGGDWLLVDGICDRRLMDVNMKDLFRYVQMYKPEAVGIELSGQQKGFVAWTKQEMLNRNIFFRIASDRNSKEEGFRPSTSKLVRFNATVPLFKNKKIWFPKELKGTILVQEAVDEITHVTTGGIKSKRDDFIDNISQLPMFDAWKPSEEGVEVGSDSVYDYSEYIDENSGRLSSYII